MLLGFHISLKGYVALNIWLTCHHTTNTFIATKNCEVIKCKRDWKNLRAQLGACGQNPVLLVGWLQMDRQSVCWAGRNPSHCKKNPHILLLVYADGSICLDILQNRWSPTYDVSSILTSIQVMLVVCRYFSKLRRLIIAGAVQFS